MAYDFSKMCEITTGQIETLKKLDWWLSYNHCGVYLLKHDAGYNLKVECGGDDLKVGAVLSQKSGKGNGYKQLRKYAGGPDDLAGLVAFAKF